MSSAGASTENSSAVPAIRDDRVPQHVSDESTIRYDCDAVMCVGITESHDDKVIRERIDFGEPWDPPAWRA